MYRCLLACLLLGSSWSCSGETDFGPMGSVSGKLTLDGQPLSEGTMLLFKQMQSGYAAFGETDAEGNYSLTWIREGERKTEIPAGEYHVLIMPPGSGDESEELSADEMLAGGGSEAPPALEYPPRYKSHTASGLKFKIEEGPNTVDITLESNPT
jgi:hypothetical protein